MDSWVLDKRALAEDLILVHKELRLEATDFPAELRSVRPSAEDWTAMELLGHVAEMHYSYVARARNLIAHPGAELARDMESPERIGALHDGATVTLEMALGRLDEARHFALAFLDTLKPADVGIEGFHRSLGQMTVRDVFGRTIVGHARNHLEQLRETRKRVSVGES